MFKKILLSVLVCSATLVLTETVADPHGGGLDSEGCHYDRRRGGRHCHGGGGGGGGYNAPRASDTKMSIVTVPRAEVWVDGKYWGVSPTKAHRVSTSTKQILLRHPLLGEHRATAEPRLGESTDIHMRW